MYLLTSPQSELRKLAYCPTNDDKSCSFHAASSGRTPVIAKLLIYVPQCLSLIFDFIWIPFYPTWINDMPVWAFLDTNYGEETYQHICLLTEPQIITKKILASKYSLMYMLFFLSLLKGEKNVEVTLKFQTILELLLHNDKAQGQQPNFWSTSFLVLLFFTNEKTL